MFELDNQFNVFFKKNTPGRFIFNDAYRDWLKTAVVIFQDLTESYRKYISGDGRLIGLEKNTLKIKLESLLYMVISLLQSLAEGDRIYILEENGGRDLHIKFNAGNSFEIKGAVSEQKISERNDMSLWINGKINPMLKNLISMLGKSLMDGKINSEEKDDILKGSLTVLIELIYINISIEYTEMSQ